MGVGYNFVCRDCKKYYVLGYGSYSSWIWANTLEEFDKGRPQDRELQKNRNLRGCLKHHEGHDFDLLNMDYTYERDGKLWDENASPYSSAPDTVIADLLGFDRVDLGENPELLEKK